MMELEGRNTRLFWLERSIQVMVVNDGECDLEIMDASLR
ncbi:unnamed protein product [Linum tenue]|uniref:Uncharacterized protein n=1 Tax=Linum tenue TaxID=586396 RepID=A0AAV0MR42_9ROSI|nr:unnamed protein product [Linum tenue]